MNYFEMSFKYLVYNTNKRYMNFRCVPYFNILSYILFFWLRIFRKLLIQQDKNQLTQFLFMVKNQIFDNFLLNNN